MSTGDRRFRPAVLSSMRRAAGGWNDDDRNATVASDLCADRSMRALARAAVPCGADAQKVGVLRENGVLGVTFLK